MIGWRCKYCMHVYDTAKEIIPNRKHHDEARCMWGTPGMLTPMQLLDYIEHLGNMVSALADTMILTFDSEKKKAPPVTLAEWIEAQRQEELFRTALKESDHA